ncbi:MAG TPA: bacteriohemerythrin [bacterium]|nr:bacteriohemerythrin [bacterium]HPT30058.1 bacteriohemerythrin [bacterium]
MYFKWKPEYSFDIKEIDDQHRYFVSILDKLYDSIVKKSPRQELGELLKAIIDYATNHFSTEEKYFDKFNYEGAQEHKEKHRELKDKILDFQKKFNENGVDISVDLIDFLEDWLVNHLLNLDRKYVDCFHEHGLH